MRRYITAPGRQSCIVTGLVLALVAGCGADPSKAEALAEIEATFAKHASSSRVHEPAESMLPWEVGQWVLYLVEDKDKRSTVRYSVVGSEGDAHWLEIKEVSKRGTSYQKWLVSGIVPGDPGSVESIRFHRIIMWSPPGQETPMEAPPFAGLGAKAVIRSLIIDIRDAPREDAVVPAGTFVAAAKKHVRVNLFGINSEVDSWSHGAVPIWGLVEQQGATRDFRWRLAAFGLSGAEPEVPEPTSMFGVPTR